MSGAEKLLIWVTLICVSPIIPAHFNPSPPPISPPGTYSSYRLGPICVSKGGIHRPRNEGQVLELVRRAVETKTRIKAFGSRHSITDIICTDGIALDMSGIKGMRMNKDHSVSAGAGVTLKELGHFLLLNGRAIQLIPAFGGITVGGAIGTGAHGSSLKHESILSGYTQSLKVVDGRGQVRVVSGREEMRGWRIHLGMLGVILQVTLRTVPLFKLRVHHYEVSDEILTNGLWEWMGREADTFFLYWFPSRSVVVVCNGTFVGVDVAGNAWSNDHAPPTTHLFNTIIIPTAEMFQEFRVRPGMSFLELIMQKTLTSQVPFSAPIYTEDGRSVMNPAVGYAHDMMAANCDSDCSWDHYPVNLSMLDNEMSFHVKDMKGVVETVKHILHISPATFPAQGILLRFSKGTDTFMAPANGRDTVHFEWYSVKRKAGDDDPMLGLAAYQAILQALAFDWNGRSHWGKTGMFYHSRAMIQRKVKSEHLTSFLSLMKRNDPHQIFINSFGRRLLNISDRMDIDPRTKHCALLDNCLCQLATDCARNQFCGTFWEYPHFKLCRNVDEFNPFQLTLK